ncbi:hypothetical protein NpPPO83_00003301 [Neofusicoccum parvum]|uniref:Uncharacterized protein n=1 Tax=Neofusicoccum parvum TaxID=310453 RepID=A0ACB5SEB2_9PEZI|nr:hypothetical protein NpPPO83_00003301 [Neofusicoccum parvum]
MTHAPRWTLRAAQCRAIAHYCTRSAALHLTADVLLCCSPVAHGAAVPLGKAPTDAATFLSLEGGGMAQRAVQPLGRVTVAWLVGMLAGGASTLALNETWLRWRLETFEGHLALVGSHLDLISVELDTLAIVVDSLAETPDLSCPDLP